MTIIVPAFLLFLSVGLFLVAAVLTAGLGGELNKAGPSQGRSEEVKSGLRMMLLIVTLAQFGSAGGWIAFGYVLGAP